MESGGRIGPYVLDRHLGRGGFGEVWKAWDPGLNRWVALKFLASADPAEREQLRREARTAAQLVHPNIAAIYESREDCIVMQFVDGTTLAVQPRNDLRRLVSLARDVACALHYAHGSGVIHRDVKPANIMIDSAGRVYLMDFGLAKSVGGASGLSMTGVAIGTPSYMPPEQARGLSRGVGPAADVYSLGATLYELLAGRPPFSGTDVVQILLMVAQDEPRRLRELNPQIDPDLDTIVMKCLEKEPARRYASAQELGDDLARWLAGEPIAARPPSLTQRVVRKARRHAVAVALTAVILAVLGAGLVVLAVQKSRAASDLARREAALHALAAAWAELAERWREYRTGRISWDEFRRQVERRRPGIDAHIAAWPKDPTGYYLRARAAMMTGDLDAAERDLSTALATRPDFRPGWSLLGMLRLERHEEASYIIGGHEAMSKQQAPNSLDAALAAFSRGWEAGREEEEARRWGLVRTRDDEVMERVVQSERLLLAGDRKGARQVLADAWQVFQSEEYANRIGLCSETARECIEWQAKAVGLARGYAKAWYDRGSVLVKIGKPLEALPDFDRAVECRPDFAMALLARAIVLKEHDRLDEARRDFDGLVALRPRDPVAFTERAMFLERAGDPNGAKQDFDYALELNPKYAEGWHRRGHFQETRPGGAQAAVADLRQAVELTSSPGIRRCLAMALDAAGDFDGALREIDRALDIDPNLVDCLELRGGYRFRQRQYDAAIADLTHALKLKPDCYAALINRGKSLLEKGDLEGALRDANTAVRLHPKEAAGWRIGAEARGLSGDWTRALADYDTVIALRAATANDFSNRGVALIQLRRAAEAIKSFERAVELAPRDADKLAQLGRARAESNDMSGALEALDRSIAVEPTADAHDIRGMVRAARGEPRAAMDDFNEALRLQPGHLEARANRGSVRARSLDELDAGIQDIEQALAAAPANWTYRPKMENLLRELKDRRPK